VLYFGRTRRSSSHGQDGYGASAKRTVQCGRKGTLFFVRKRVFFIDKPEIKSLQISARMKSEGTPCHTYKFKNSEERATYGKWSFVHDFFYSGHFIT
jgi:hypothetical protein